MSDYTTQLRWPVERKQYETKRGPDDYSTCYSMLGLDDYPIFDESYRPQLNDKIIRHFYFREIGFETLAQFRWYMRRTMHENMPYFNQLYNSLNLITDPITNQKYTWGEVYNLEQGGTTATDTKGTSHDDDTMDSRTVAKTDYGKTDDSTTRFGKTDDTTTTYGKTEVDTTEYGKTDDTTTTYGKTGSKVTDYGKTTHDETTTEYGRTQHTENGGADNNTEGGIHERVVREDTPMNLIPDGAIENLNYATEVTYTDREGTSAAVIEYGGTTDIENGGADTTTSDGTTGGRDTVTDTAGGSDIVNNEQGGTDVLDKRLGGADMVAEREGGSQNTFDKLGGSDTTTTTAHKDETHDGRTTGRTDFERNLDENGSRDHNRIGYDGISPSDLLKKYRETFLNVDMQVIASLETLFFGLWN